jgi:hypothetical protein
MEHITNTRDNASDLPVDELNPNNMHYTKRLELFARWLPICQDVAHECNVELPSPDRLRLMILSAHQAMCLLASSALAFPGAIMQDRIVTQFLIDCFTADQEG